MKEKLQVTGLEQDCSVRDESPGHGRDMRICLQNWVKHRRCLLSSGGLFFVLSCGASLEVFVPSSVCCLERYGGSALEWRGNEREGKVTLNSSSFSELCVN